jgi:hypothetical protein
MGTFLSSEPRKTALRRLTYMSSLTKPVVSQLISGGSAANADELGEAVARVSAPQDIGIETVIEPSIESTGGWDAYDVWRRFIKEARDRRKLQDQN